MRQRSQEHKEQIQWGTLQKNKFLLNVGGIRRVKVAEIDHHQGVGKRTKNCGHLRQKKTGETESSKKKETLRIGGGGKVWRSWTRLKKGQA